MVIENVLEYGKAMAQFSEMFPTISHEGIDKILAWGYKKYIFTHTEAIIHSLSVTKRKIYYPHQASK
jgi:hypothetical protein